MEQADSNLTNDLILDFQDQKLQLDKQVQQTDPMATALHTKAGRHFFQTGFILFLELLVWVLLVACVAFLIFMDKLYPFHFLFQIKADTTLSRQYHPSDLNTLIWGVKGLVILLGLVLFWAGRMLHKTRKKNALIKSAGSHLRKLMELFFDRQRAIRLLEDKYPLQLPADSDTVELPPAAAPNPKSPKGDTPFDAL